MCVRFYFSPGSRRRRRSWTLQLPNFELDTRLLGSACSERIKKLWMGCLTKYCLLFYMFNRGMVENYCILGKIQPCTLGQLFTSVTYNFPPFPSICSLYVYTFYLDCTCLTLVLFWFVCFICFCFSRKLESIFWYDLQDWRDRSLIGWDFS